MLFKLNSKEKQIRQPITGISGKNENYSMYCYIWIKKNIFALNLKYTEYNFR